MPQGKKSGKTYRILVLRMETNYGVEITYRKYVLQARADSEKCVFTGRVGSEEIWTYKVYLLTGRNRLRGSVYPQEVTDSEEMCTHRK